MDKKRWCNGFTRACELRHHKRKRIAKKNVHRIDRLMERVFIEKRWGGDFPVPNEWLAYH